MRALAKLLCFSDEFLAAFFPELLRLIVLGILILWKQCKQLRSSYKYRWAMNKKSCNLGYNRIIGGDDSCYCSICLSEFEQGDEAKQLVDCRHVFHRRCLERWLRWYRATCPLCRSVVVPEVIVREYHRTQLDQENDRVEKELALILLNLQVLHGGRSCRRRFFQFSIFYYQISITTINQ